MFLVLLVWASLLFGAMMGSTARYTLNPPIFKLETPLGGFYCRSDEVPASLPEIALTVEYEGPQNKLSSSFPNLNSILLNILCFIWRLFLRGVRQPS
jgi:hypothetical protein